MTVVLPGLKVRVRRQGQDFKSQGQMSKRTANNSSCVRSTSKFGGIKGHAEISLGPLRDEVVWRLSPFWP